MSTATMDMLDIENSTDNKQDSYAFLLQNKQGGISTYIGCEIKVPLKQLMKGLYNDIVHNTDIPDTTRAKLADKVQAIMDSELSMKLNSPEMGLPYLTEYLWSRVRDDIRNGTSQKQLSDEITFSYYVQYLVFSCLSEISEKGLSPFSIKKRQHDIPKIEQKKEIVHEVSNIKTTQEYVTDKKEDEDEVFIPIRNEKKKKETVAIDPIQQAQLKAQQLIEEARRKTNIH